LVAELLNRQLSTVTVDLFSDYDLPIRSMSRPPETGAADSEMLAGVVGYVGERIRGALVIVAKGEAVRSWLESLGAEGIGPEDAIGEIANMTLGRLKAKLMSMGVTLQLSTPTIASGTSLRLSGPPSVSASLPFEANGHGLVVRLDAKLEPGFELKGRSLTEPPAEAGDFILF
jgi:CheY-specific phosphatase CheX